MYLKRVFTVLLCLNAAIAAPAKSAELKAGTDVKKSAENDSFWNNTVTELFGPGAADCNNQVLPLKQLFPSQKEFQESFSGCRADASTASDVAINRLCLSALYNMRYACRHVVKGENRSVPASDLAKTDADDLCSDLKKWAVPLPGCKGDSAKACDVSNVAAFQFKNDTLAKPLCDACVKTKDSENVCRYLRLTYKAIDILDKYQTSDIAAPKSEPEEKNPAAESDRKEVVNPGQEQSNVVDAELEVETSPMPKAEEGDQVKKSDTDKSGKKKEVEPEVNQDDGESLDQQESPTGGDAPLTGDDDDGDGDGDKDDEAKNNKGAEDTIGSRNKQHDNQDTKPVLVDHLSNPMKNVEEASNYLNYLLVVSVVAIAAYLLFHNKQKILALILEGRRGRKSSGRRRTSSSSARYRKLDNNLEEAMGPGSDDSARHVIY